MMESRFGDFARQWRVQLGETLRHFCRRAGLDSAYISKVERGLLAPPQSPDKLEHYALSLGIAKGGADWNEFMDLAAAAGGRLPQDLLDNPQLMQCLPVFLRTIRNERVDEKSLDELIEMIRNGGSGSD
jgi:transcriptional regulator with XRE-family HTH domain